MRTSRSGAPRSRSISRSCACSTRTRPASRRASICCAASASSPRSGARRAVEQIYGHRALERDERPVALSEQDLFSVDQWFLWGLNRRQLVASGAAGGAAVGGAIDAAAHGASLLAGALLGAAIGGAG